MIETILALASVWGPSLVAILGIVCTVITAINKVAAAIADTKSAVADMKADETFKQTVSELQRLAAENKELAYSVKVLTDEITRIEGYTDGKRGK